MTAAAASLPTPFDLLRDLAPLQERNAWSGVAALLPQLPAALDPAWLAPADKIAFALGRLRRFAEAIDLLTGAHAVLANPRRASSLAYLHYAACMELVSPPREPLPAALPERETLRDGFRRWMKLVLDAEPDSIKDLYRLGVWEAQVESRRDKPALAAFERVVAAYRALDHDTRERRHDFRKYYVKALYAAARSSMRLGNVRRARHHIFQCIREDRDRDHVAAVFKYHLAGNVCARGDELDVAERAFRLALDAAGPRDRSYVLGDLAQLALRRDTPADAVAWIEPHTRPERRDPSLWRLLGEARRRMGDPRAAENALRNALLKDRSARHRTLVALGDLHREQGALDQAAKDFEQAREFRRRRWMSDDLKAVEGLLAVREAQGRTKDAEGLRETLVTLQRSLHRSLAAAVP
jgi:tetratricopeptide (TPR) repeat protein